MAAVMGREAVMMHRMACLPPGWGVDVKVLSWPAFLTAGRPMLLTRGLHLVTINFPAQAVETSCSASLWRIPLAAPQDDSGPFCIEGRVQTTRNRAITSQRD